MDEDPAVMPQEHTPVHADEPLPGPSSSEQPGESPAASEAVTTQQDNQHNQGNPDNLPEQPLLKRPLDQEDTSSPEEELANDQSPPPSSRHSQENNDNSSNTEPPESLSSSNKRRRISVRKHCRFSFSERAYCLIVCFSY